MDVKSLSVKQYQNLRWIFLAIVEEHLCGPIPVVEPDELQAPPGEISVEHYRWLKMLDSCASPERFRRGIETCSPDDALLITLLDFLRSEPQRQIDHDRFDWLITYLLKRRGTSDQSMGGQILEMLPDLPQAPLSDAGRKSLDG